MLSQFQRFMTPFPSDLSFSFMYVLGSFFKILPSSLLSFLLYGALGLFFEIIFLGPLLPHWNVVLYGRPLKVSKYQKLNCRKKILPKMNGGICFSILTVRKYLKLEIEISSFKWFRTIRIEKQTRPFIFGRSFFRQFCFWDLLTFRGKWSRKPRSSKIEGFGKDPLP